MSGEFKQWSSPTDGSAHTDWVNSVAFSPDGRRIVSGSQDRTIRIWNALTGECLRTIRGHQGPVEAVAFSPDGTSVVSGSKDNTVRMWDAESGTPLWNPPAGFGHVFGVSTVAFSPDGGRVVSGAGDKIVCFWNRRTGISLATLRGHDQRVFSTCFSPDGASLVSGSSDQTACIWRLNDSVKIVLRGHNGVVLSVDWKGSKIVSGSADKTVRVWDSNTGSELGSPLRGHTGIINSVSLSPDAKYVVSGSWDEHIKLWDIGTFTLLQTLQLHTGVVESVDWSLQGDKIVSGSWDNSVCVLGVKMFIDFEQLMTEVEIFMTTAKNMSFELMLTTNNYYAKRLSQLRQQVKSSGGVVDERRYQRVFDWATKIPTKLRL